MSLPTGEPSRTFYSQRVDPKPWVNCLPYSLCPVLSWMGYAVPRDYGSQLRKASGVPMADGRGTSYADMRRALTKLLPGHRVVIGAVSDGELINLLAKRAKPGLAGTNVVSVTARMERLPTHLRRHVGKGWEGLHALTLHMRKRAPDGTWLVYLSDPMGRTYRGYTGEWVRWGDISPALKRNANGLIRVGYGAKGAAL
jgi:hypothetical protein